MSRGAGALIGTLGTLTGAALFGCVAEAGAQPASPAAGPVRSVTLDEAVEVARRESPLLREATANLRSSEAGATGALGGFLPNISLGYGYSEASTGRLDATGQGITTRSYTSRLRGSLTLFDGFQTLNDLRTARAEVSAQEATLEERRFDAVLSVKTAFFNAVAARERAAVEAARVERQEEQLGFTRALLDLGRGTRSDTLRARVDLNDARLALLTARNDARSAEFALAEAMGLEERVAPSPEARLEGVASARSSYWPSLSLNGGWDWRNEEFPPANRSWSVSFSGSVPIFNGLQRETGVDRAQAQVDLARARRQSAELAVRTQVQGAYDQIQTALAGLELAEESVEAAAEDLRVSRQRYRLGVATSLDLRSAQIALAQAQVDVIRRRFDHEVGIAQLERLLGTSIEQLGPGSAGAEEER